MQLDVYSIHARQLVPRILKAFEGKNDLSNEVKTTLNYFRNWNYEMRKENVTTSLFQSCFIKLIENTFRDEMGDTLMALYDTVCATPINAMINLLQKPNSLWFDNINTPIVETSDEIIRLSLDEGIKLLRNTLGGDLKTWQWGELHQVEFKHPFGEIAALRPVFNVGPFPTHGAHSTVSKGDFWIGHPFNLSVGPSTRQIFDLSDKNNGRAVTPPGQSGQAFHKHYDDQIPLWINGGYRKMTLDKSNIENSGYELLRLIPKK
jgi:penicillin amidase